MGERVNPIERDVYSDSGRVNRVIPLLWASRRPETLRRPSMMDNGKAAQRNAGQDSGGEAVNKYLLKDLWM